MRDVAFSCDDNGTPFLNVAVYSLLSHYHSDIPLRINVFEGFGGHSESSKAKLRSIVDGFGATLRYHNVEKAIEPYADLILNREGSRWNVFTWTPIFTPMILADAEGPCIHFDIDMLFNADIGELFEVFDSTPVSNPLIACSYEYDRYGGKAERAIWENGILPSDVERYFNTGVLIFNTEACRAERTWEKIIAWYREHYEVAERIEQDAWNALYHDRTVPLPVCWNFHDRNIKKYARWNVADKYWLGNPPVECLEAALAPKLLHFWGPKKPWKPSHRPYRRLYHAAMRAVGQTPPEDPLTSVIDDLSTRMNLRRISCRLLRLRPNGPSDRWRSRFRAVRRKALVPFEWVGIGFALLLFTSLSHRWLFRVCDFASAVMYRFDRRGKSRSLENLRIVYGRCTGDEGTPAFDPDFAPYNPSRAEELIIRRSYRNMARTIGHIFWTFRKAAKRAAGVGELSPECKAFLAANHPAITVSAHMGCWEILSQLAFLEGHSIISVAKKIGTGGMTRMLMKARQSIGQEIVAADGAFKPLMAGIKNGKSLGLLVDQAVQPKHGGVFVRFFGKPISVSSAPAFFALKTRQPIIVAWCRPLKNLHYRCEMIRTYKAEDGSIWGLTQSIARDLERVIRRHPSCWVLNYNFFSNIPTDEDLATLAKREAEESGSGLSA